MPRYQFPWLSNSNNWHCPMVYVRVSKFTRTRTKQVAIHINSPQYHHHNLFKGYDDVNYDDVNYPTTAGQADLLDQTLTDSVNSATICGTSICNVTSLFAIITVHFLKLACWCTHHLFHPPASWWPGLQSLTAVTPETLPFFRSDFHRITLQTCRNKWILFTF